MISRHNYYVKDFKKCTNTHCEVENISVVFISAIHRAALTTHELEWLEPWGKLAELELKCSNRELVYVRNTNITEGT